MSVESVKNFYEKIANDKDFQKKLDELQNKATEGLELPLAQDKKEEIIKDVIIPFAKEQGFDFSIEDIKEFEQSIIEQLDEEQLKNFNAGRLHEGGGIGGQICFTVGFGLGFMAGIDDDDHGVSALCVVIGFGIGKAICFVVGIGESIIPCNHWNG